VRARPEPRRSARPSRPLKSRADAFVRAPRAPPPRHRAQSRPPTGVAHRAVFCREPCPAAPDVPSELPSVPLPPAAALAGRACLRLTPGGTSGTAAQPWRPAVGAAVGAWRAGPDFGLQRRLLPERMRRRGSSRAATGGGVLAWLAACARRRSVVPFGAAVCSWSPRSAGARVEAACGAVPAPVARRHRRRRHRRCPTGPSGSR